MEIRSLTEEDLPALAHIAARSFDRGRVPTIGAEVLDDSTRTRLGAFENGRLEAQLSINHYSLFFGKDVRPCGGIAGVMCEPAYRGRGYAGALIKRSLEAMKDAGLYLSCLWPFDFRFYQQYGWDWAGMGKKYRMPLRLLRPDPEANCVEHVVEGIQDRINPIYEAQAVRYQGAMVRDAGRWKSAMEPVGERAAACYVYRGDGADEGFAIVRYSEKKNHIEASDFVALTIPAYRGLMGLLRRHSMSAKSASWWGPEDDPAWSVLYDWEMKTELWPRGMERIVDVRPALEALKTDSPIAGTAVIELKDEHAPWNAARWSISAEDGIVRAAGTLEDVGLEMDIRALSQAYWGTPSLWAVRAAGRIEVHRETDFEFLSALMPARPVWLTDDF